MKWLILAAVLVLAALAPQFLAPAAVPAVFRELGPLLGAPAVPALRP